MHQFNVGLIYKLLSRQISLAFVLLLVTQPNVAWSQTPGSLKVVVNSNQDTVQADDVLTLREAIALVNGSLSLDKLSQSEKNQVQVLDENTPPRIEFNLASSETAIALKSVLPLLTTPNLVIDGTTQPGYQANISPTAEISIPTPVVTITPADGVEVFRGFSVAADNITIRGLSLYGFTSYHGATASTPPADIFIASSDRTYESNRGSNSSVSPIPTSSQPPKNVLIENNWLGIPPNEKMPPTTSAFGVSVFNAVNTTIRRNRISYHDGSAIITGVRAEKMQVLENIIVGNGIAGMPDAIRLEGMINQSQIRSNLLCGNDGSGVFLFKPQGAVQIQNNQIKFNGLRFRRAAVYLMGSEHQVTNNQISYQSGAGVVVTSYPQSDGNIIQNNSFSNLEGLSIDLNAVHNVGVKDFQNGDGPNPERNSPNRRLDTANAGINTPKFLSPEFFNRDNSTVGIDGVADVGSQIDVYRVSENNENRVLSEALASTTVDAKGKFSLEVSNLQPGDKISAIATHPKYGTSEPAYPAVIRSINNSPVSTGNSLASIPQCLTPPIAEVPPELPPPLPPELPPPPIRLQIPKNIHFALDKANISPASAKILDKIVQVLRDNPAIFVEMEGHTDPRASNAYNDDLAKRRVISARNYLMRQGIAPHRMIIRSFGEMRRLSNGSGIIDYARDRRVEFIYKDIRGIEVIVQEIDLQLE